MLEHISWGMFFKVMGGLVAAYYVGLLVIRYRPKGKAAEAVEPVEEQGLLFPGNSGQEDRNPELFQVMERVISLLKGLVGRGVAEHWGEAELKDHIYEVLSGYHQLRRTPYEVAINNFIVRTSLSNFSLELDAVTLEGLWNGKP